MTRPWCQKLTSQSDARLSSASAILASYFTQQDFQCTSDKKRPGDNCKVMAKSLKVRCQVTSLYIKNGLKATVEFFRTHFFTVLQNSFSGLLQNSFKTSNSKMTFYICQTDSGTLHKLDWFRYSTPARLVQIFEVSWTDSVISTAPFPINDFLKHKLPFTVIWYSQRTCLVVDPLFVKCSPRCQNQDSSHKISHLRLGGGGDGTGCHRSEVVPDV